ncbi:hypothetical protein LP419_35505 [Massilia sp. H-1]|nr:hypothetical protein LP419_35505 [Massilia sp. H-1]
MTRSGDEITVELTISAYGSDEGLFFGVFLHDVTERQRAEFVLQQERELINAVLETIDVGVVACSAEGELTLFNRGAREFHGLLKPIRSAPTNGRPITTCSRPTAAPGSIRRTCRCFTHCRARPSRTCRW